jgi:AcrR family transcriptional regulator
MCRQFEQRSIIMAMFKMNDVCSMLDIMLGMSVLLHDIVPVPTIADRAAAALQLQQRQQRQQTLTDARRALVLDAARAVFAEHGVEGASIRVIAKRAGYTAGAIYSYFDSKEAIYAALLRESLERLQQAVDAARASRARPDRSLAARASAWFHFYARNPRDLDLGFYLVQGLAPRGLTSELDRELNQRLLAALQPCKDALLALGLDEAIAQVEHTALFAHGIGLLLLQHTGRIRSVRSGCRTPVPALSAASAAAAGSAGCGGPGRRAVRAGGARQPAGSVRPLTGDGSQRRAWAVLVPGPDCDNAAVAFTG